MSGAAKCGAEGTAAGRERVGVMYGCGWAGPAMMPPDATTPLLEPP